jgi:D-alanyl-D-alanine carboxypeptidase
VRLSRGARSIARDIWEALTNAVQFVVTPRGNPGRDTAAKHLGAVYKLMGDPRNVAHAKKVVQEKRHQDKRPPKAAAAQSAKKLQIEKTKQAAPTDGTAPKTGAEEPAQPRDSAQLEKSHAVLSNLKELEFHSRANLEKLAELSLTIEEELKQRAFAEAIGAVYSAQDAFQSKIVALIENYEAECARL